MCDNLLTAFQILDVYYLKQKSNNFRLISDHLTTLLIKFQNLFSCTENKMYEELQNCLEEINTEDLDIDSVKWWVQMSEIKNFAGYY